MIYFNILGSIGLVYWVEPIAWLRHGLVCYICLYLTSLTEVQEMNLFSTIASVVTTSVQLLSSDMAVDTEILLVFSVLVQLLLGGSTSNWFLVILISLILILLLLWLLFLRRLLYNRFTRSWRSGIGSVSVLTYVPHFFDGKTRVFFI